MYCFHTGRAMKSESHNCETLCDTTKIFSYLQYSLELFFISLELNFPGSHLNLVLSESDKTGVLLFFKKWRIQMNCCMPTHLQQKKGCSNCKDLLEDHCLLRAGLWKRSPLLLEVLSFSARGRQQEALRPTLQDERNIESKFQNSREHLGATQPEHFLYLLYLLFGTCIIGCFKYKVSCHGWHDFS